MGKHGKKAEQTPQSASQSAQSTMSPFLGKKSSHRSDGRTSKMAESAARSPSPVGSTASGYSTASTRTDVRALLSALPTKDDLRAMAKTLRESQKADLAEIKAELRSIGEAYSKMDDRLGKAEQAHNHLVHRSNDHHRFIYLLRKHMEDLDNRGRRNNLRIRGIPDSVAAADLGDTVRAIFNSILGRDPSSPLELDRVHLCCVHKFTIKEDITRALRNVELFKYQDYEVSIFQDLAWLTIQQRRALRPLTTVLRAQNIAYRWSFPFALTVVKEGRQYSLKEPDGLEDFVRALGLPSIDLKEWRELAYNGDLVDTLETQQWHCRSRMSKPSSPSTPRRMD
ncbi:hypothetical protein XELAEV_18035216mg [Xenopus laevis]|uniref:Uncharacterized protein n=1 Tax=Xenopus laevis TaxID=8355 RepID=A0A974CGF6_XENLA|nr:hypothetical protein XELAEV_18035216mg [Xenopus laevis]